MEQELSSEDWRSESSYRAVVRCQATAQIACVETISRPKRQRDLHHFELDSPVGLFSRVGTLPVPGGNALGINNFDPVEGGMGRLVRGDLVLLGNLYSRSRRV